MVDLRPLLFINFLMVLLLIITGLGMPADEEQTIAQHNPQEDQRSVSDNQAEPGTTITTQTPEKPLSGKSERVLAALKKTEEAAFSEEAIFADEVPVVKTEPRPAPTEVEIAEPHKPEVVAYKNTAPTPAPKPKPITTGTLIVRSNVSDDTVLVNGKPYGPTKLEMQLTPGNYNIEVAKDGFDSWVSSVDIRRGSTKTLNAKLVQFTKVDFVDGVWANDIKTGEGSYIQEGQFEYNGSFVNGKFHGMGSVRYANGMKYQGEWFEGNMQGNGTLTTTDGDTYIGELDENEFNGEGTLTKATGDIYTGFWIDGVLNGQGSLTTKGGLLYVGGFSDNLFHGNGSLTYPDGGHYEGSFSNGMFHGKGVETYANGKKYVGQFIDGLYHGKGEILNPNGSKITGTFKDGKPFGKATLTTAEGEVFTARSSEPGVCYRTKSYRATECPELEGW